MADDQIRYDILTQEALRGVVRKVLAEVAKTGLPGEHHFFISFATKSPGVRISERLLEQYDKEMTIVLQNQYWDLKVTDTGFEVGLSFDGKSELLSIPFSAIKGFFDPSVQFGLQIEPVMDENEEEDEIIGELGGDNDMESAEKNTTDEKEPETDTGAESGEKVVSLDSFRKK
jgi:uncharacterized protein